MEVSRFAQMLRYLGPKWLMYRAVYALRMKSGLVRMQRPATTWDKLPLEAFLSDPSLRDAEAYAESRRKQARPFFFDAAQLPNSGELLSRWDTPESSPFYSVDRLREGFVQFFSNEFVEVGLPPQWHRDPLSGHTFPNDRHWSQIGDFGAGDIKLVWEANRFGFVFPLVRAYWRTGDEAIPKLFWDLIEDWRRSNPPDTGSNWKCGQEISLRVMAWVFGLHGFGNSPATTPARVSMLAQMIAVSGQRIESNIGYALSQQNNHGISEAMGLWTVGSLFPELKDAARWSRKGRRLLESQAQALVYDDGAFSQHSLNYHRVMLHNYLWSIRLGDLQDSPLSSELRDRIGRAGEFVYQLQDKVTGRVPRTGQDDGAYILPLSNCAYDDYRGVVQSTHYLLTGQRLLPSGPWDEELFWLFGLEQPSDSDCPITDAGHPSTSNARTGNRDLATEKHSGSFSPERRDFDAADSGYVTLRTPAGCAISRAAGFRHRPAQADMLHVDIWWRGLNIALDPGTYSYNSPAPWNNPFSHTEHHNTVSVDGRDQMDRASRFLWLPWLKGTSHGRNVPRQGDVSAWNGEHDGYRRLADPVTHRRGVARLGAEHWLIVDALCGQVDHQFRLHWLLMDGPFAADHDLTSLEIQTPHGPYRLLAASSQAEPRFQVIRADEHSARGWYAPFYHSRRPALSVSLEATTHAVVFASLLGPEALSVQITGDHVQVRGGDWQATVSLNLDQTMDTPLVASVTAGGSLADSITSIPLPSTRPISEPRQCTSC
ncbi:heparinase II/III domain-containing protein [Schlesneria sp.]|uniref:alginate lyase family protein n=1 Tax=Schlesneria sp. TaxID=2762018 RepID=UPI002EE14D45